MSNVIVTDEGFVPDAKAEIWIDLPADTAPTALESFVAHPAICIAFDTFSDGRGFTLAARLRRLGFVGRLRASGHILADQYAMARRAGFDEVAISAELAARQPEAQWRARADWRAHDYRRKLGLRGAPASCAS